METLPSDSRQPPDGHEFPDYVEDENKSEESYNWHENSSFSVPLSKTNSVSNSDLRLETNAIESNLHTRSQSLIDMSSISKQKPDRWNLLAEQRKKSYSKLKGLVIPEHVSENETTSPVNIPEIISHTTTTFVLETKIHANEITECHSNETEPVALPLTSPPWASNTNTLPKYSPAFKRKSLQVYSKPKQQVIDKSATKSDELRLDNLSDSPKSLESITSPTRSDCSFDYVAKTKPNRTPNHLSKLQKSEDESDNDSAVSSSQSSYISRCSPPSSPTRSCEMLDFINKTDDVDKFHHLQSRLLKAASVEAINRKNILASAKCRSGRDLKVGSPVIQRKYEDDESSSSLETEITVRDEKPEPRVLKEILIPKTQVTGKNFVNLRPVVQLREKVTPKSNTSLRNNNKSLSVTDLRKSFEQIAVVSPPLPQTKIATLRKEVKNKSEVLPEKKINGTVRIETVKPTPVVIPNEVKTETQEVTSGDQRKIVLCTDFVGGSIGVTLAGGTDYETKEITIYKIRYGSVAYKDGRLKKGDRIISINGKSTANLTHAESVELLKEAVSRFVLIVEDGIEQVVTSRKSSISSDSRKSFEFRKSLTSDISEATTVCLDKKPNFHIAITKNGAGLGFSIEGGKDSPQGDLPIRVKKIFQGGLAEKTGELCVGDEILGINDIDVRNLSRIETWSLMKKLPDGNVIMHILR